MASLKFIMDMDDEELGSHDNKKDVPPSTTGGRDLSSASASTSHANPGTETASQSDRIITPATTTTSTYSESGGKRRGLASCHSKYSATTSTLATTSSSSTATTATTASAGAGAASSSSSSSTTTTTTTTATSSSAGAAGASLLTTANQPTPIRQQSSTSAEEMDRGNCGSGPGPSGGGHASGSSGGGGSNTPNRPMGNPPDIPVKLTPITGRVSRAKKGVPVHTCEICRPPKTFTRAEHLRRHQLSHQSPGFACTYPGCDRAFFRADLLARHASKHDHEGDKASSRGTGGDNSRRTSTTSMDDGIPRGYMPPGSQPMGGPSTSRGSMSTPNSDVPSGGSFTGNPTGYQTMSNQGSGSGTPMSPPQMSGRRESYQSTSSGQGQGNSYVLSPTLPLIHNQPPSLDSSPTTAHSYGLEYAQPRTSPPFPLCVVTQGLQHHLPSLTIPDSNPPGLLAPHEVSPWASSDSAFSTPSDVSHKRGGWARGGGGGFSPTSSDWPGHYNLTPAYHPAVSQDLASPGGGLEGLATTSAPFFVNPFSPSYGSVHMEMDMDMVSPVFSDDHFFDPSSSSSSSHHHHPPFSSVRSPTPPTLPSSVQSAETLVSLAPAPTAASGAASSPFGMVNQPAQLDRLYYKDQAALTLGSHSGAAFLTAHQLPRPVRNAIPDFLDVYWKCFDANFPLVHRRSFETTPNDVLRCAMAAVATQFLDGRDHRVKGNLLHEFAWQEIRRAPQWNVSIMQAILLCEFYTRFRGKKAVIRPSQHFQSLYSRDQLFSLVLCSPVSQWHPYSTFYASQVVNNPPTLSQPSPITTIQPQSSDHTASPAIKSPKTTTVTTTLQSPMAGAAATAAATAASTMSAEQRWQEWIEAEARRRLLAACFVLDVHTFVYHQQPLMQPFTNPYPPIPLTTASKHLWAARSPESWDQAALPTNEPQVLSADIITPERIASSTPLDRMVFLAAEALRLPKRPIPAQLDLGTLLSQIPPSFLETENQNQSQQQQLEVNNNNVTSRIEVLFPDSPVAHTYLALHFTPLHDLLAVSGDSWLFTHKVLGPQSFQQHQKRLKAWSGNAAAAMAARFAAKALLGFLHVEQGKKTNVKNTSPLATTTTSAAAALSSSDGMTSNAWNRSDISDYWALYVCALVCWAISHQPTRGGNTSTPNTTATTTSTTAAVATSSTEGNNNANQQQEAEAMTWLRILASMQSLQDVQSNAVRGRRDVIIAGVAMVRRRLEGEAAGAGKSRLLVDALSVLRKLEEGVNWKWF